MGKTINDIIGAKINSIVEVYDYWQVITNKGTINIYNPSKYITPQGNEFKLKEVEKQDLVSSIVTNVEFDAEKYLKIEMDHMKTIEISLLVEDYCGPEAISVHFSTGEILVFE